MKPVIYTSQDIDAPQLNGNIGEIKTVIKACLVTGYGDKHAAGWDIVHEDNTINKLAISSKHPKSIKSIFVISDNVSKSGIGIRAFLQWDYQNNLGVDEFASLYGMGGRINSEKWVVIANDRFCWLSVARDNAGTYGTIQAFGDANSVNELGDYSVVLSHKNGEYNIDNTNINTVVTSAGIGTIAKIPFPTLQPSALGDRSIDSNLFESNKYVFSNQMIYLKNTAGKMQPAFYLPGLLMPWVSIPYQDPTKGLRTVVGQDGFSDPIVLLRLPWQGYVPVQTDNWE